MIWIFAIISLFILIPVSASLTDNLIRYYTMDAEYTVNNHSIDSTGTKDGVIFSPNITAYVNQTGKINEAYEGEGTGSHINLNSTPEAGLSELSWFAWVNTSSTTEYDLRCPGYCNFGASTDRSFRSDIVSSLLYQHYCVLRNTDDSGETSVLSSTTGLSDGQWHFLGCVYNGTHLINYVDGVQDGTPASHTGAVRTSGIDTKIGKYDRTGGAFFEGLIDEAGLWSRGLTPDEVLSLYNSGEGLQYPFIIPPNLTIAYPVSDEWTNGYVNGTCTSDNNISIVTINNTDFNFSSGFNYTNWQFEYTGNESLNLSVLITCSDIYGTNTTKAANISMDVNSPYCYPLTNQSLNHTSSFVWNVTCIDDLNFYLLNVTCTGGTNFSYFKNNINSSSFIFMNDTGNMSNNMTCTFFSADAHTDKDIRDKLNWRTVVVHNPSTEVYEIHVNGKPLIRTEPDYSTKSINNLKVWFDKKDRVRFEITNNDSSFDDKKGETFEFTVLGENNINYYQNNKYKGWFVVDNHYWIDFNVKKVKNMDTDLKVKKKDIKYTINRINQTAYGVSITVPGNSIEFDSFGLLNTNTQIQYFKIFNNETYVNFEPINLSVCPVDSFNQIIIYGILLIFSLTCIGFGLWRSRLIGSFGGMLLWVIGIAFHDCNRIIGYLIMFFGIIIAMLFIYKESR